MSSAITKIVDIIYSWINHSLTTTSSSAPEATSKSFSNQHHDYDAAASFKHFGQHPYYVDTGREGELLSAPEIDAVISASENDRGFYSETNGGQDLWTGSSLYGITPGKVIKSQFIFVFKTSTLYRPFLVFLESV